MQTINPVEWQQQFLDFCSAYVLLLGWMVLALPRRWFRRIVQIALGIREG